MYYDVFYFYKFGLDIMIREHTWKKPGDPVIRSQTEIQFLWRRRAKLEIRIFFRLRIPREI